MKISAVPSLAGAAAITDAKAQIIPRTLKMATNATPEQVMPPAAQETGSWDDNKNTEANPTAEATQPISPQFAALSKQRRALQQERRAFDEERKAFEQTKSQGSDAVELARLKSEPWRVLQEAGVSPDLLTQQILASQGNQEVEVLKREISALKEGVDKRFQDQATQTEQQVLSEMKREAEGIVKQNDDFELVRETGSIPDVMRLIEMVYRESGEVLEVPEALKLVEDELFERNQKLLKLKKMQGLIQQPEPVVQQRPQGMRTLTNKDTASVPMSAKQRALAAFYGTLKK